MHDEQRFINCLRRIEFEFGKAGWHGDENVEPALYGLYDVNGRHRGIRLGIDSSIWTMGPPGLVMEGVAQSAHKQPEGFLAPFRRPGWYGLAFAHEAWVSSSSAEQGEEHWRQVQADADARRIRYRPDRKTMRFVCGLTRELKQGFLWHEQDAGGVVVDRSDQTFTGTVIYGMTALVATIDELLDHTTGES